MPEEAHWSSFFDAACILSKLDCDEQCRDVVEFGCGRSDESVEYAMLFNILHIDDPVALLREAYRVLTPGGGVGFIHWNYDPTTPLGPSMDIRPRPEQGRAWAEEVPRLRIQAMQRAANIRNVQDIILDHRTGERPVQRLFEIVDAVEAGSFWGRERDVIFSNSVGCADEQDVSPDRRSTGCHIVLRHPEGLHHIEGPHYIRLVCFIAQDVRVFWFLCGEGTIVLLVPKTLGIQTTNFAPARDEPQTVAFDHGCGADADRWPVVDPSRGKFFTGMLRVEGTIAYVSDFAPSQKRKPLTSRDLRHMRLESPILHSQTPHPVQVAAFFFARSSEVRRQYADVDAEVVSQFADYLRLSDFLPARTSERESGLQ